MEIDAKHCNMDALDTSKGARLMSVNTLGNESDIQEALLFLPDRNEKWLQGKIEKYSDNSKDGKNTTKDKCFRIYGIFERQKQFDDL